MRRDLKSITFLVIAGPALFAMSGWASGAQPVAVAPKVKPQSQNEVSRLLDAERARLKARAADRFAETAPAVAAGTKFRVVVPTTENRSAGPYNVYRDGVLIFAVPTGRSQYGKATPLIPVGFAPVGTRSFVGQNAFGAQVQVTEYEVNEDNIAMMTGPPRPPELDGPARYLVGSGSYYLQISVPGPEARRLVQDVRAIIEGVTTELPSGATVGCSSMKLDATLQSPVAGTIHSCWLGAKVTRIAVVDEGAGKTLAEWTGDANAVPPEPAPEFAEAMIAARYPREAKRKGIGGSVMLRCGIDMGRFLKDCVVLSEDPPKYGFGAAALSVANLHLNDEQLPGTSITFTMKFRP